MNGRRLYVLGAAAAMAAAGLLANDARASSVPMFEYVRPEAPRMKIPSRKLGKKKRKKLHAIDASTNYGKPTRASRKWARKRALGQMMWRP